MLKGILVIGLILLLGITVFCVAQDTGEQLTITTYYPSPYGVYKNVRLFPYAIDIGDTAGCSADQRGTLAFSNTTGMTLYCNGTEWQAVGDFPAIPRGIFTKNGIFNILIGVTLKQDWQAVPSWTASTGSPTTDSMDGSYNMEVDVHGTPTSQYSITWNANMSITADDDGKILVRLQSRRKLRNATSWGDWFGLGPTEECVGDGGTSTNSTTTNCTFNNEISLWPGKLEEARQFRVQAWRKYGTGHMSAASLYTTGTNLSVDK